MQTTPKPVVGYDVQRMAEDMAAQGLDNVSLGLKAKVADVTVGRFLKGTFQTARTAKKLAQALGYSPGRYIVRAKRDTGALPETMSA